MEANFGIVKRGEMASGVAIIFAFDLNFLVFVIELVKKISLSYGGGEYFGPNLSRILFQNCTAIVCLEFILFFRIYIAFDP